MTRSKALITGSSGFVGLHLKPYLEKKGNLTLSLSLRGAWQENFPLDFDSIVHLAGKAHDTHNTSDPEAYFRVNTDLTAQLFDLFLKSRARDFIYFSSVKAVADKVDNTLTEDFVPDPQTPYGQSKRKAEEYLLSKQLPAGKRLFILRPCMIHGPGNKGNLNLLYKVVRQGIPYPLAAFDNKRSFLSVKNLIFIVGQILDKPNIQGGIYNVADDEPLATIEIIEIMRASGAGKGKLWYIPKNIIRGIAKAGDKLHLPLNSERLKKLTDNYVVSNEKIKQAIGFHRLPVSSREGLSETIKSFGK